MINNFESLKAMKVGKISDLSSAFEPTTLNSFHIYIVPLSGAAIDSGETMILKARPTKNSQSVNVPVCVGDWSPVVFAQIDKAADQSDLDLSKYDVYYSEIENY